MSPLTLGLLAALLVMVGGVLYFQFSALRRDDRVRLPEMLARQGVALPETLLEATATDAALATRRCWSCPSKSLCDEWLQAKGGAAPVRFCPNAPYIEHLRRDARALPF